MRHKIQFLRLSFLMFCVCYCVLVVHFNQMQQVFFANPGVRLGDARFNSSLSSLDCCCVCGLIPQIAISISSKIVGYGADVTLYIVYVCGSIQQITNLISSQIAGLRMWFESTYRQPFLSQVPLLFKSKSLSSIGKMRFEGSLFF